jgi:hypothetical protein
MTVGTLATQAKNRRNSGKDTDNELGNEYLATSKIPD